jgi:hypothetical protein
MIALFVMNNLGELFDSLIYYIRGKVEFCKQILIKYLLYKVRKVLLQML